MTTEISIPADILQKIEAKREQLRAEKAAKEEADKREQDELFARGSQIYTDYRNGAIEQLPEWIREYVRPAELTIDSCIRLGKNWGSPTNYTIMIDIPGLTSIEYEYGKTCVFRCLTAEWNGYAEDMPRFNTREWKQDLEYVLCMAERELAKHNDQMAKWEAARAEVIRHHNEQKAFEQEAEKRSQEQAEERAEQEASDKREEIALFNALKDDPIAVHLLKAFVLLRFERSHFEDQLIEADETISSIEHRYTRRAEELRRQADEAERRAQDEKDRLQSDLDDAEAKLKKAQRGW